jgi:hypothetical protein
VHELHTHHQVDVEEISRASAIGANPACQGCQMDDDIRPTGVEHTLDIYGINQVIFIDQRTKDICSTSLAKPCEQEGA